MATFKRVGTIGLFKTKMIEGMVSRGYERSFAERCFSQIEGFGEYGFPESHAASFALLVYASAWMKCRYPDVFCAAMLNAQPMGFYAPAQLVRDAREHGVEMREIDINFSDWDSTLEGLHPPSPLAGEGREGGRPQPPPLFPHSHVTRDERAFAWVRRHNQTKAESLIWRELRAHRLDGLGFRRQVPIGSYVADFVCYQARLVVELDGEAHSDTEARDRERDAWFSSRGYRTLRFTNDAALSYPERVLESIRLVCTERATLTNAPSPPCGGETERGTHDAAAFIFPPSQPSPARGEG
jgi:very-short-patch-repair endonuclease